MAERFCASPNSKEYGITSVTLQAVFNLSIPRVIKKECFTPSPKVDSALVKFVPHNKFNLDFALFSAFVASAFAMRRKTLFNNLKQQFEKQQILNAFKKLNLPETVRPENLAVAKFKIFFKKYSKF